MFRCCDVRTKSEPSLAGMMVDDVPLAAILMWSSAELML
jgi:hypothetical protein